MSKHTSHTQFRPQLEQLEGRSLMAAITATLSSGILSIHGTVGNDRIVVRAIDDAIYVDNVNIAYQGKMYRGAMADMVQQIRIQGGAGDDYIDLHSELGQGQQPIKAKAMLYGGPGNDWVLGGAGNDRVCGGPGNDVVAGGFGNDLVMGDAGNDFLAGDDIIDNHAKTTRYDGNDELVGAAGVDRFYGQGGFDWYHDDFVSGQPFANGQSVADVEQHDLGTCQTLAAMTALTRQGHSFSKQIKYLGDNSYRVVLFDEGRAVGVHVKYNGWWNDNEPKVNADTLGGATSREYWPILIQRARLQMYGVDWTRSYSEAQFSQLHRASGGTLQSLHNALEELSGRKATVMTTNRINPAGLQAALEKGHAVMAGTRPEEQLMQAKIVPSHAYAVMNVVQHNGDWFVQLHNPWNVDSASGERGDGKDDGFLWVSWKEFTTYFFAIAAV